MGKEPFLQYSHSMGFYAQVGRGFNNPVDVAIGGNGVMYVLNRAGADVAVRMPYKRVTMCTADEDFLGTFGTGGAGSGELMWPASIATDGQNNVYVSDEALHRITVFDADGQLLGQWGVRGAEEGAFDRPAGIAFDHDENLLVVDGINNRIQRYTKEGRYLGGWGRGGTGDGEFDTPWGITVGRDGSVYVADWRNDRIQKFDADGGHLATWGAPGHEDGQLNRPAGVAVDDEDYVYVADWGNERVQVLRPDGSFLTEFHGQGEPSKWAEEYFVANQDELEEREKADLEPSLRPDVSNRDKSASIEKLFWGTGLGQGIRGQRFRRRELSPPNPGIRQGIAHAVYPHQQLDVRARFMLCLPQSDREGSSPPTRSSPASGRVPPPARRRIRTSFSPV